MKSLGQCSWLQEPRGKVKLNILPLGSYDCLIGMEWLDQHHSLLDYCNKNFTCLDEEGNQKTVQGIPRVAVVR
jgi:hypothetical protein